MIEVHLTRDADALVVRTTWPGQPPQARRHPRVEHRGLGYAGWPDGPAAWRDLARATGPVPTDVARVGRVLYDLLFDADAAWPAVAQIRLRLDPALAMDHLPWELLVAPDGHPLLAHPTRRVGLTRVVAPTDPPATPRADGPAGGPTALAWPSPARVLFVVAAALDDPAIRAAAQYVCVLRQIESAGLAAELHVEIDASQTSLAAAVRRLRPHVVHLVAHGELVGGRPTLSVRPTDQDRAPQPVAADVLADLLAWDDGRPDVVLVDACQSGATVAATATDPTDPTASVPLAATLVARGVPVAVGMGGSVRDVACRLHARALYEALLRGQPVEQAARVARRAARAADLDPLRTVEWARPALFLAEGCDGVVTQSGGEAWRRQRALVGVMQRLADPPVYCGRPTVIERARAALDDGRGALVVCTRGPAGQRLGLTRTLSEIAADAWMRGWLPLPLLFTLPGDPRPATLGDLVSDLIGRARRTLVHLREDDPDRYADVRLLGPDRLDRPAEAGPRARRALDDGFPADDPEVLRAVLLDALDALAVASGRRPLIVLDDVHRYGGALARALIAAIGPAGLGKVHGHGVPVALSAHLGATPHAEETSAADAVRQLVGRGPTYAEIVIGELDAAQGLDWQAVREALLTRAAGPVQPRSPTPDPGGLDYAEAMVLQCVRQKPLPSAFTDAELTPTIDQLTFFRLVGPADDTLALRQAAEAT